jgi:hypothetical protein
MKRNIRLVPALLSMIVLAAHFLRMQNFFFMVASLALTPLLFSKKQWIQRAMQILLFSGSIEWVRTRLMLVMERKALGLPFVRMVLILGGVTLFTVWSAVLVDAGDSTARNKRRLSSNER